jgi:hypothetical protein
MSTLLAAILETFAGPLIILVWIARAILFGGGVLFLTAAPVADNGFGIALLYFAHAVAMTLLLRFLRRLRARAMYR